MGLKLETFGITWRDQSAVVGYGSLRVRLNTLDVDLIDPTDTTGFNAPGSPTTFGPNLRCTSLGWSGVVGSYEVRDMVNVRSGHVIWHLTATNLAGANAPAGGASMVLSDQPANVLDDYLLEDGSGHYLLETDTLTAPGALQIDNGSLGYQELRLKTAWNGQGSWNNPQQLQGELTVFTAGLWPGLQFTLFSNNLGIAGTLYTITEIDLSFHGLGQPVTHLFFGSSIASDVPITLNAWKKV